MVHQLPNLWAMVKPCPVRMGMCRRNQHGQTWSHQATSKRTPSSLSWWPQPLVIVSTKSNFKARKRTKSQKAVMCRMVMMTLLSSYTRHTDSILRWCSNRIKEHREELISMPLTAALQHWLMSHLLVTRLSISRMQLLEKIMKAIANSYCLRQKMILAPRMQQGQIKRMNQTNQTLNS